MMKSKKIVVVNKSEEEERRRMNGKVIDNLMNMGDRLGKPREITHWFYFNNEADREALWNEIKDEGFEVVGKNFLGELGKENPYSLIIGKIGSVLPQEIDEAVIRWVHLAKKHNGAYDGWETSVELE